MFFFISRRTVPRRSVPRPKILEPDKTLLTPRLVVSDAFQEVLRRHVELSIVLRAGKLYEATLAVVQLQALKLVRLLNF